MTYDIYLSMGCRALPDIDNILPAIPALSDAQIQQKIVKRSPGPGFLGLNLTHEQAMVLLQRLKSQKAAGYPVLAAYHEPKITKEQAAPIAAQAIKQLHEKLIPQHTLGPALFKREEPVCWTFGAVSAEWVKEGRIPGILFASVDKLDAHVWALEEFNQLRGA
jgi:hypothetical protein